MSQRASRDISIDAQALPLAERVPRILAVFDALSPGESFEFVSGVPPRRLLAQFQNERKGLFEWSPLEQGPEVWRIELLRRAASSGDLRQVTEALAWDHERLDELESMAMAARSAGDFEAAKNGYARFACGLKRHIRFEEEVLFPRFEQETGLDPACGPTAVMRLEHGEILLLLESTAAAIGDPGSAVVSLRRRFHEVMGEHNEKEELVLYPGIDHLVGPQKSDALVARFQDLGV
jgi:regulator of cell morphogenesis and NO signaling